MCMFRLFWFLRGWGNRWWMFPSSNACMFLRPLFLGVLWNKWSMFPYLAVFPRTLLRELWNRWWMFPVVMFSSRKRLLLTLQLPG